MDTASKILEARNALTLCENLLLEAYMSAGNHTANSILLLLESLTTDREAITSIHHIAALEEKEAKAHEITNHLTTQSTRVC